MSKILNHNIVSKFLRLIYYVFIITGILPFGFDFTTRKPFVSKKLIIYKCSIVSVIGIFYKISLELFISNLKPSIYNETSLVVANIELLLGLIVLIVITMSQMKNFFKMLSFLKKFQKLYQKLTMLANVNVRKVMIKILVKFSVSFLVLVICTLFDVFSFGTVGDVRLELVMLNLYYPTFVLLCVNTMFYTGITSLHVITEKFNEILLKEVLGFQNQIRTKKNSHSKYCQMSDFIDQQCILQSELNELYKLFNNIFKISVLFYLNFSFMLVANQVTRNNINIIS
jgi:hypothetical protein